MGDPCQDLKAVLGCCDDVASLTFAEGIFCAYIFQDCADAAGESHFCNSDEPATVTDIMDCRDLTVSDKISYQISGFSFGCQIHRWRRSVATTVANFKPERLAEVSVVATTQ